MAGSYTLPQTRVFQEFSQTPNDVTQNLNPFVIGPNYQLMRYAREDERGDCAHEAYAGAEKTIKWSTHGIFGSVVDPTWYGVTFKDAYVSLGPAVSAACLDATSGNGVQFELTLPEGKTLSDGADLQFGVPVKPGDYLSYGSGASRVYTKILKVSVGKTRDSDVRVGLHEQYSSVSALGGVFTVNTAKYKGEKPVTVTITVTGAPSAPKITWFSTVPGISNATAFSLTSAAKDLGLGLEITKGSGIKNGVYILTVDIVSSYVRDTVTVADLIPYNTASVTIVRRFANIACNQTSLAPTGDGVTVSANAAVDVDLGVTGTVLEAEAYLDQRNLRKDHIDRVYSVRTDSEIATELGAFDTPDNPLAYAAHIMLLNNANTAIKFIGLKSDDMDGYTEALKRASVTTEVYAFCPLTENKAIIDAVVADCNRLSKAEEKSWRIAFFSMPTEESFDVTPMLGSAFATCTVTAAGKLTCSAATFSETVRVGDKVTVVTSSGSKSALVLSVDSNTQLTLADWTTAVSSAADFRIEHTRAPGEYVEAIAETSANFKDRRAYNVFPNTLRASDGNLVSGMYGAAAVCALACSVAPQQPITNVEIKGFVDLPDVYGKFSRDELNEIAAGGTLILMQEKPGGTVYVRHQISTAYRDGNLNTTELSLTKNLDSISYYFANRTSPYIGKYNITDDLLTEVRGVIEDGLTFLETTTETNKLVGPQVIAEGTEIRSLYRTAEKDKAYCDVALNLPAPFNNFDLHLQVI